MPISDIMSTLASPFSSDELRTVRLADNTVGKLIESLLRVNLIILDELGFAPLDDHSVRTAPHQS